VRGVRLQLVQVLVVFSGFSFLLHFVWELLQSPLYSSLRYVSHTEALAICTRATAGDVGIAVAAYVAAATVQGDTLWILRAQGRTWSPYMLAGLGITVLFEYLATGPLERWTYAPQMPRLPLLGTGLAPLLQWLLLPPLAAWFTYRHSRKC